ncbi:MAG TPA: type II toxin-antitoxin system VapB family antitoxin [Vicinamibacterales bacterium]|nr:type II toxin-antitoxin system VapB family antitoxin [Acidobacteriota bacterium]HQX80772.1 type II toxin-antitoxin system VapB family antitoxin [Vicinamibacterales bacterium]
MALNIKNASVERLAGEVALLTGETKTEAIRKALEDRKRRLVAAPVSDRRAAVLSFLKKRVWKGVPRSEKGRVLSRTEEDAILGYGPEGV